MSEQYNFDKMIEGQEQHYSDKKFLNKIKNFGGGLGYKAIQAAVTLFVALRSPNMSKANKLIVLGALGYFILPIDLIADFLPLIGLSDDAFIILTALGKVYLSITEDMKLEAKQLIDSKFNR
ncbi:YkvA family protein [Solibacillus silvestris]|uniref:YkvA family protein n=1 Tax=Solibacillus silvestris TaxID=76853 RepID=UPI003F7D1B71